MPYLEPQIGPAVVVTFIRRGTEITLDDRPPLRLPDRKLPRMFVPRDDLLGKSFFYEIVADGEVIFRATASDPTGATIEVPAAPAGGSHSIERFDNAPDSTTVFTLIVPAYPDGASVRLYSAQLARIRAEVAGRDPGVTSIRDRLVMEEPLPEKSQ
jgi:hypothetical protein